MSFQEELGREEDLGLWDGGLPAQGHLASLWPQGAPSIPYVGPFFDWVIYFSGVEL